MGTDASEKWQPKHKRKVHTYLALFSLFNGFVRHAWVILPLLGPFLSFRPIKRCSLCPHVTAIISDLNKNSLLHFSHLQFCELLALSFFPFSLPLYIFSFVWLDILFVFVLARCLQFLLDFSLGVGFINYPNFYFESIYYY